VQREESRHDFAFIAGVIVGAISGALATLALTPMSGTETREKVMERVGDMEPVKERVAGIAASAQHMVETGREKATEMVARSPLPFGEHAEPGDASASTATVSGGVVHPQDPVEGSLETVEGNGMAPTPIAPERPPANQA
jgi:gas vesicle protein